MKGEFDVSAYQLEEFFEENELDYDHEVVIRRQVSPAGKSRAFVNDTPVNNQVLRRLTEVLVDLHQQFDVLDIHNVNFQMRMIDALANNQARLKEYGALYRSYSKDKKQLAELIERSETGAREMEFLLFQLEELRDAELQEGEQEDLESGLSGLFQLGRNQTQLWTALQQSCRRRKHVDCPVAGTGQANLSPWECFSKDKGHG